jgi:pimeloyl-ACP methyl ester carboxylesterase
MRSEDLTMTLADGRTLAWAEYGVPEGRCVLFFHGGNDSRLAGRLLDDAAIRAEVRLICPDRPGYGASTFLAGRTFLDWASDVSRLADELGIAGYGIVGHSGGGPHALACAYANPERVHSVATVSSPAPPAAPNRGLHPAFRLMNLLFKSPALYRPMAKNQLKQMATSPERWLSVWGRMQPADGELFRRQPEVAHAIIAEMTEGARQGVSGIVHEASLYHAGWGFGLREVATSSQVWHGRRDRQAAMGWSEFLAEELPHASLRIDNEGGHFSTLITNAQEILTGIASGP